MKLPLYSSAHCSFVEEESNGEMWDSADLAQAISKEHTRFLANPSVETYPDQASLLKEEWKDHLIYQIDELCGSHVKELVSLGCGWGGAEIWLARKRPEINFLCIDRSPLTESLNSVVGELGLDNIRFQREDILKWKAEKKYDVVMSHAVVYAFNDYDLGNFFLTCADAAKPGGTVIISSVSNISRAMKIAMLWRGRPRAKLGERQIGWLRDKQEIRSLIPNDLVVEHAIPFAHDRQVIGGERFRVLKKIQTLFSQKVIPFSNCSIAFYVRKKTHSHVEGDERYLQE